MLLISLLGPVEVVLADGERRSLGSIAQRATLAALALRPGEVVSADRLMAAIWGDDQPVSATSTLHAHVSRLRRAVGPDHIATIPPGYSLVGVGTDVETLENLIAEDRRPALKKAIALWRGDPFGDLSDREMFRAEAIRLAELRSSIEERLLELTLEEDPGRAVADAESLVESEPLRERRWELLARSLHRVGRTAEALRALDRARVMLGDVGLEPSRHLQEVGERIAVEEPPGSPSSSATTSPIRVSAPPGGLVGRELDLEAVAGLLADHRLVTLVGAGGVGKTHLARTVAASIVDESFWCSLASLGEAEGVASAVARAVGAPVVGDIHQSLIEWLRDRRAILVLDNCEHVVAAVARLVWRILDEASGVTILATSREPLAVAAEWVYRLTPLDPRMAAVDLFVARAQAAGAPVDSLDRNVVLRICHLLDGLPLAIEMAAARSASLGVEELERLLGDGLAILSDRKPGGARRSLEEVVAWSVDLLDERQRRTLEGAASFAGQFDLTAARAVLGAAPVDEGRVPALLASLAERSLLEVHHQDDEVRYSVLYTIRRVVADAGDAADRGETERRHARYFADLAEDIGRHLIGPQEVEWSTEAVRWLAELRAAVFRAPTSDEAIRICRALYPLAYHRSRADVAAWAEVVFPAVEGSRRPGVGAVGAMAAISALQRGEMRLGAELVRRARAATTERGDLLRVLEMEGDLATYTGSLTVVDTIGQEMSDIAREEGDVIAELLAMLNMGLGRLYAGNIPGAREMVERVRELEKRSASPTIAAWADYMEGEVRLEVDADGAAELLDRAAATAGQVGARLVEGVAGLSAASVRARHGDIEIARRHFERVIRHWLEAADWVHQWVTMRNLALLLQRSGDDEGAAVILVAVDERERPTYGEEAERLAALGERLVERLGEEGFRACRLEAAALSDRQVVEYALERLHDD